MEIGFIDLKSQYRRYKAEIDSSILRVLDGASFILGKEVHELEEALSGYAGVKHSISCSSGTDALLMALMAFDVGPGDEVITTPFTFFATAEVVSLVGARPVFVDIRPDTYNINPQKIVERITERTKAIVPVDIFGQVADLDEIMEIARPRGIAVIEDAAQSFGAEYRGRKACSLGNIACTSFFPSKPLGCYGDGGAAFSDDDRLAERIRVLINHGQTRRYVHSLVGINGRLDTIQAAILLTKLEHFEQELVARTRIAKTYIEGLSNVDAIVLPSIPEDRTSVFAQFSIQVPDRSEFVSRMQAQGIPTAIHYPIPLYRQEAFSHLCVDPVDFPITEGVCRRIVSLPMSAFLSEQDQSTILQAIVKHYGA